MKHQKIDTVSTNNIVHPYLNFSPLTDVAYIPINLTTLNKIKQFQGVQYTLHIHIMIILYTNRVQKSNLLKQTD